MLWLIQKYLMWKFKRSLSWNRPGNGHTVLYLKQAAQAVTRYREDSKEERGK